MRRVGRAAANLLTRDEARRIAQHGQAAGLPDQAPILRALLPLLKQKSDSKWRDRIAKNVEDWWKTLDARAMEPANPVNPQRVTWELLPRLPDRVILTSDSGSCANWYARDLKIRRSSRNLYQDGLS